METATTTIAVTLDDAAGASPGEIGHKARNLAILRRAGMPVPDGVVILAAAFTRFVAQHGFGPATTPADVRSASLPADVATALHQACTQLGWPVAVRSSGVAEDLAGASFAGQYESVLNVENRAGAEAAVLQCWASVFDERVARYRPGGVAPMAVLVQRMVPADAAGVAFTANPVSGARDEVIVDAVAGLADRLVAGEVDGEHWLVRDGAPTRMPGTDPATPDVMSASDVASVAELARRVEGHFGVPQDVEWAMAAGKVFVVQARPITGLPDAPRREVAAVPDGFWEREVSHAPRPHSPMSASFFFECVTEGLRAAMAEYGLLVDTLEFRDIEGWTYARLVPLGGKDRPAPPPWLMPLLLRAVPTMRRRIRQGIVAARTDLAGLSVERWYGQWQPDLWDRTVSLRSVRLDDLSDAQLAEHLIAVRDFVFESTRVHFLLHVTIAIPLAEFALTSRELLEWDDAQVWELVAGLSRRTTEPARRLADIARMLDARPDLRALVKQEGPGALEALRTAAPEVAGALDGYLTNYGFRTLTYDVAEGTLAESPELFLSLISDQLTREFEPTAQDDDRDAARSASLRAAREALAGRSDEQRQRWEGALERATRAYPIRDDNGFYTVSGPLALVRRAALEVGRRLVERGQLDAVDDCFQLTVDEALTALRDGVSRTDIVVRRRARRVDVETHPGPPTYGTEPAPPPVDALPVETRPAHRALLWYPKQVMAAGTTHSGASTADGIRGLAASRGRYRGPSRIIRDERDFDKLRPGDVMVCPMTSPVWSVLFPTVGAVVTDSGGMLSHPAIIAREYGVPAVVATGDAPRRLHDGDLVTVDGTAGVVELEVAATV